jgi:cytidine deaminase
MAAPLDDPVIAKLMEAARQTSRHSYAPYSRFAVGAALLMADGSIITGANFENASFGLSLCAETVALATANSGGHLAKVVALAVLGGALGENGLITGSVPVRPCGRCRQLLAEAAQLASIDIPIYCGSADGRVLEHHLLSALLPYSFGPQDLAP